MKARVLLMLTVCLGALGACAPSTPELIRQAPVPDSELAQVRLDPAAFRGTRVRWGGRVMALENRPQDTWIQVLSYRLDGDGEPRSDAKPGARFIARVKGFLEPSEYAKDRLITVAGRVDGVVERPVGEFPYPHVQVDAEAIYLWPVPTVRPCCPPGPWYDPWYSPLYSPWYDPWYDPWWPRRRWR